MAYTRMDDFFYLQGIEIKAAKRVYEQFRINRYELNMLASLAAYLQIHGKKVISKGFFFDWLGGNRQFEVKGWKYIEGLINKGALHRLAWRNKAVETGNSLAISEYGSRILQAFYGHIEDLDRKDRARKGLPSLHNYVIHSDSIPAGYTLRTAGRND